MSSAIWWRSAHGAAAGRRRRSRKAAIATVATAGVVVGLLPLAVSLPSAEAAATSSVGKVQVMRTTADLTDRLTWKSEIIMGPATSGTVTVNDAQTYQDIDGFGAAFTDTSTWLLKTKLSDTARAQVMKDLFSRTNGIGLSFMRVPMGDSDYNYDYRNGRTYDDNGTTPDPNLTKFSIARDESNTIPIIKEAQGINPTMKLVATPWTPPKWMKDPATNTLLSTAEDPLANYFVKFLQDYKARGVNVWAVTPQNEPKHDQGLYWEPAKEADFIKNKLGPKLQTAGLTTKILAPDGVGAPDPGERNMFASTAAGPYLTGLAYHCYVPTWDQSFLDAFRRDYPGKRIYLTECSPGNYQMYQPNPAKAILKALSLGANGADLWNLALDQYGGPKNNQDPNNPDINQGTCPTCTAPVTVNKNTGVATYNIEYYQLGQFSKFIAPGAKRIGSSSSDGGILAQAFLNPDLSQVLVAHNDTDSQKTFTTNWNNRGSFSYTLPAHATVTFKVNNKSTVLGATADTYVRDGSYADTNFGGETTMVVKNQNSLNSSWSRKSLLNFNVSGVTGPVSTAVLRVYGKMSETGTSQTVQAFGLSSDTWTETGATWNTAPGLGAALGTGTVTTTSDWVDLDVTSAVQAAKSSGSSTVSLAVYEPLNVSGLGVSLNSRENSTNQPRLVVRTG